MIKCHQCGLEFESEWTDEEAKKEHEERFGMPVDDTSVLVCDDCYEQIMTKLEMKL